MPYVEDYSGKKIINFKLNNLHLVGYSIPINKTMFQKKNLFLICIRYLNKQRLFHILPLIIKNIGDFVSHINKNYQLLKII